MRRTALGALALLVAACGARSTTPVGPGSVAVKPLFAPAPADAIAGCIHGSLLHDVAAAAPTVVFGAADGTVYALDADTGAIRFTVPLPAPDGEVGFVAATPLIVGRRLIVAYHTIERSDALPDVTAYRRRHRLAAVDLDRGALDPALPPLDLQAEGRTIDGAAVEFAAAHALARATLVHLDGPGALGRVVVTFGNPQDIQPWHGWVMAIDLDAWAAGQPASIASLLTTPEADCGPVGTSGSRGRVCGGGVWTAAGPWVLQLGDKEQLVVATGNGAFDLGRHDYANALLRVAPDLSFDPGCDPTACAGQTSALDDSCAASCANLFYPRLAAGQASPRPESGVCDGMSMFDCWARLDWDFGAGTPALANVDGRPLLVHPAKDGALYLIDGEHLGTLLDRLVLAAPCGTAGDPCGADWAGMMVTRPAVADVDGTPLAIVPTFEFDRTHPAGLHGVRIGGGAQPQLSLAWRWPAGDDEARGRFRRHPSEAVLAMLGGRVTAWVLEQNYLAPAHLYGVDAADGRLVADQPLSGRGMRFQQPLVVGDRIYVGSCESDQGRARVEAFSLTAQ